MRVTLVRHARSATDPATPSHTWDLSDEGRRDALGLRLDGVSRLLAESRAGGWLGEHAFAAAIERYFQGAQGASGWELAAEVVARFTLVDGAAIVSGGRAIAAVVAHVTGGDGVEIWRALRFPDVVHLDQDERDRWVASKP